MRELESRKIMWPTHTVILMIPVRVSQCSEGIDGVRFCMSPADDTKYDDEVVDLSRLLCAVLIPDAYKHAFRYARNHVDALYALLGKVKHNAAVERLMRSDGDRACMTRVAQCLLG